MDVLEFIVDDQCFGIALVEIREILRAASLTRVPQAPPSLQGLLNIRGQVIPVLDLRFMLGCPPREIHPDEHMIVLETKPFLSVIRVDRTIGINHIITNENEAGCKDDAKGEFLIDFVANTSVGIVNIINSKRLLDDEYLVQFIGQVTSSHADEVVGE